MPEPPRFPALALLVAAGIIAFAPAKTYAGATAFFSPVTINNGTATFANPNLDFKVGDSFSLGIWISALGGVSGIDVLGLDLDVVESTNILTAVSHQIQEGNDSSGSTLRWLTATFNNGTLNNTATALVSGANASGLAGYGTPPTFGLAKDPGLRGADDDFDAAVTDDGAFLHSILNLQATTIEATNLYFQVGPTKIAYLPATDTTITFGAGANQDVDRTVSQSFTAAGNDIPDATINVWAKGDVNKDGFIRADDIDLAYASFSDPSTLNLADLDNNARVEQADITELVQNVLNTDYGDANFDLAVDLADFNTWLGSDGGGWAGADFNGDQSIDLGDFNIWLMTAPPAAPGGGLGPSVTHVPEPTTLALLGLFGMGLVWRARRAPDRVPGRLGRKKILSGVPLCHLFG